VITVKPLAPDAAGAAVGLTAGVTVALGDDVGVALAAGVEVALGTGFGVGLAVCARAGGVVRFVGVGDDLAPFAEDAMTTKAARASEGRNDFKAPGITQTGESNNLFFCGGVCDATSVIPRRADGEGSDSRR
jgi:hypothetical protein